MTTITQASDHCWREICRRLHGPTVVFLDQEGSMECLHWHGGLPRLLSEASGIEAVLELSSFEKTSPKVKNAAFVVNGPVLGLKADVIREILSNNDHLERCLIITDASPYIHCLAREGTVSPDDEKTIFQELEEEILEWMGASEVNSERSCEVLHMPFHAAPLSQLEDETSSLFVMPAFNSLFPLLDPDVDCAHELFKRRSGVAEMPAPNTQELALYPPELTLAIRRLASGLNSLMQTLGIHEDIFTVGGSISKVLGEQLEILPAARLRRKNFSASARQPRRVSLILVDRTLDLAGPTKVSALATELGKIKASLPPFPGHVNDVFIDMAPLFLNDQQQQHLKKREDEDSVWPAGCLADSYSAKKRTRTGLASLLESNDIVLRTLCDELASTTGQKRPDDATLDRLQDLFITFWNDDQSIGQNVDLLSRSRAVIQANSGRQLKKIAEVQEKFISSMRKPKELRSFLVHVTKLLRQRRLSLDEILLLTTFCYAMLPADEEDVVFYHEDEDRLQSALSEALVRQRYDLGPHSGSALFAQMDWGDKDNEEGEHEEVAAFRIVKSIFHKLNALRSARKGFKGFESLIDGSTKGYRGFLHSLMSDLFAEDRRSVGCLQHHKADRGLMGGLLKSGIGLLGVNVNRMHPRENPELWVFVTGGITADEVASIRQVITESSSSCRLVIGATKLTSPEETLKSLFVKSPLLTC